MKFFMMCVNDPVIFTGVNSSRLQLNGGIIITETLKLRSLLRGLCSKELIRSLPLVQTANVYDTILQHVLGVTIILRLVHKLPLDNLADGCSKTLW